MQELKWKAAIERVLDEEKRALHYTEIAEFIANRGYRKSLGATPQDTVSAQLTTDINTKGEKSIFAKVDKGIYILRKLMDDNSLPLTKETAIKLTNERLQIVNAFGIYWSRNLVHWRYTPDLLGKQLSGASAVNFKDQIGIYLLHDRRETIYVGQAIKQPLGARLKEHTTDRLNGRWDRFSWFGFYPVNESGSLNNEMNYENMTVQDMGNILEAVLIESIEPRQNRKQGNLFSGIEYLQEEAPEILRKRKEELIREIAEKL